MLDRYNQPIKKQKDIKMGFYKELIIEQEESGGPSDDDIMMMHLEYDAQCRIAKALCSMSGHSPTE